MDPYLAFILLVAAAVTVEAIRRRRSPEAVALRRFRAAQTIHIADARASSVVRIDGKTEATAPSIVAPLSGANCVAFQLEAILVGLRDQSEPTRRIARIVDGVPFLVRDDSGVALVDPRDDDALVLGRARAAEYAYSNLPEPVRALIAARGYTRDEVGGAPARLRCFEVALTVGDRVQVFGLAHWETAVAGAEGSERVAYRGVPRVLRVRGAIEKRFVISKPDAATTP